MFEDHHDLHSLAALRLHYINVENPNSNITASNKKQSKGNCHGP